MLKDQAIILRSTRYQDRHQIVTALTREHGKISALAPHSVHSKRFGASLASLTVSDWVFQKKREHFFSLKEATLKKRFDGLAYDIVRLGLAHCFVELVLRCTPEGFCSEPLFQLLANGLVAAEELPLDSQKEVALMNLFLGKFLQWAGVQPRLANALDGEVSLSELDANQEGSVIGLIEEASWLRGDEQAGESPLRQNISVASLKEFQLLLARPIRQANALIELPREMHIPLFQFLEGMLIYHLPGLDRSPLQSLAFLNLESSRPPVTNHRPQN